MSRDDQERQLRRRFQVIYAIIIVVGIALIYRLFDLQIVQGTAFEDEAVSNFTRVQTVPAARGLIFDSQGRTLAETKAAMTVTLLDRGDGNVEQVIPLLAQILSMSQDEIEAIMEKEVLHSRMRPIVIKTGISEIQMAQIEERREQLPGVETGYAPVREYPMGSLLSHTIGYIGTIDDEDSKVYNEENGYLPSDLIGRMGLERSYESYLRGTAGRRFVEVDAHYNIVREIGVEEPQKGHDIYLTIDSELQKLAEELIIKAASTMRMQNNVARAPYTYSGALVMLEAKTGRILAMASYPDFNLNAWENGRITDEDLIYKYLQPAAPEDATEEEREQLEQQYTAYPNPMINRAVVGALPPGSIFKPITLAAALEAGVVSLSERFYCSGIYTEIDPNPNTAPKCWIYPGRHGSVNGSEAVRDSCNSYFLEMGRRLNNLSDRSGADDNLINQYAAMFGLGEDTGFRDLSYVAESDYAISHRSSLDYLLWLNEIGYTDRDFLYEGEIVAAAIGQGLSGFTPLQMALMTMQMGNEGIRYRPYLVEKVVAQDGTVIKQAQPEVFKEIQLTDSTWKAIRDGMVMVTQPGGTSNLITFGTTAAPWRDLPFTVAGKTGTAQTEDHDPLDLRAHGWFTAFAPADDPEIAIAMVMEHGRSGSNACAPVVSNLIRAYFDLPQMDFSYIEDPANPWPTDRYDSKVSGE